MTSADTPATRLSTRLSFFAAGFAMACWAPLVPFAKRNVGAGEGELGLLLLCLGIGSLIAMPVTGVVSARIGARPMMIAGGLVMVATLPLLPLVDSMPLLAMALLAFGAGLGTLDVSMNIHAVEVEKGASEPLMSGFHGMFSVGGFAGAGGVTLLLKAGLSPVQAALSGAVIALACLLAAFPKLLSARGGEPPALVLPRGIVLVIAVLTAITFLTEGAILDWGALLLIGRGLTDAAGGGIGYMVFAIAMTIGRFTGDRVVAALGPFRVLLFGGLATMAGFLPVLLFDWLPLALAGFVLIGLGAANLVPVLFSIAGRQSVMPAGLAIAAVTTTGYAGILAGPAAIGALSHATSLPTAFWVLAALLAAVPLLARPVTR